MGISPEELKELSKVREEEEAEQFNQQQLTSTPQARIYSPLEKLGIAESLRNYASSLWNEPTMDVVQRTSPPFKVTNANPRTAFYRALPDFRVHGLALAIPYALRSGTYAGALEEVESVFLIGMLCQDSPFSSGIDSPLIRGLVAYSYYMQSEYYSNPIGYDMAGERSGGDDGFNLKIAALLYRSYDPTTDDEYDVNQVDQVSFNAWLADVIVTDNIRRQGLKLDANGRGIFNENRLSILGQEKPMAPYARLLPKEIQAFSEFAIQEDAALRAKLLIQKEEQARLAAERAAANMISTRGDKVSLRNLPGSLIRRILIRK